MSSDLVIRSRRVVTPNAIGPAAIHIREGVIIGITPPDDLPPGTRLIDAGDSVVMPGLVDTHVHINEPGRTEWEGFNTATRAAAAGGVTTLVDMPLNSVPPTTTAQALEEKRRAANGRCWVDVGFWGGVVPGNAADIPGLVEAGALGFKCFLVPSGVDEFPHVTQAELRAVLPTLASLGTVLLVHAESPESIKDTWHPIEGDGLPIEALRRSDGGECAVAARDTRCYATYLASRPPEAENRAIEMMIGLCREFGARIHIVHLSSAGALASLASARAEGLPLSVETCPHYLYWTAEEIPDGATSFKCAPPIRDAQNRERLWSALAAGLIDSIVSDHSPALPALKCLESGDFRRAWGGIASLQLGLPIIWTAAQERGHSIQQVAEWMCRGPARLAGLERRKGQLAAGSDADLVIWNPEAPFRADASLLHHRHPLTPYAGRPLRGVVEMTILRGETVYARPELAARPRGHLIRSGA